MDKVYQVFVSSTYSDLHEERKEVSDTLAKAGFIPAGMELFPATDQQQLEFIKRVIDRCDYYVVIVGGRYGSLDGDKSFTEKEFEYALARHIPILAFLPLDPGKIATDKTDNDPIHVKHLNEFKTRLKTSRIVSFWSDINDLKTKVLTAVTNAVNLRPGTGWIRGDQAIDPKLLQDLERLRIENEELKARLSEVNGADISFPDHLAGPDHEITFAVTLHRHKQTPSGGDAIVKTETVNVVASIGQILLAIVDEIIKEPSEYSLRRTIGEALLAIAGRNERETSGEVSPNDVTNLRFHIEALGLIQAIGKESTSDMFGRLTTNHYIAWVITDKGRKFVSLHRAILKERKL
ncbi:DUF4062 domain-containing protein [Pseudolabrys sp. FHR47]|uniref:DUF4062 domain-containing protein n=1 Tax=Pseudolabrys sp. FHR47 TaxID=2562284 RepID=UPI0010BF4222|nr:DUF4062 domain-containing protein [Pseudolabrys sp. FHR47]